MPTKTVDRDFTLRRRAMPWQTQAWEAWQSFSTARQDSITTGANLRDWRNRIRLGQSATTSLTGDRYGGSSSTFLVRKHSSVKSTGYKFGVEFAINVPHCLGFPTAVTGDFSKLRARAYRKFVSRAREELQAFSSGTFFGELRQTVGMVRRPLQSLRREVTAYSNRVRKTRWAKTLRQHRRGNRHRWSSPEQLDQLRTLDARIADAPSPVRAAARSAAGSWLEFAFGVQPLVSDVESAMLALVRNTVYSPPRAGVSAKAKDVDGKTTATRVYKTDLWASWYNSDQNGRVTYSEQAEREIRVHGAVKLYDENDGPGLSHAARQLGLSWADVLPTAWELMPGSFLADYFLGVGDWLERATFPRSRLAWVEENRRTKITRSLISFQDRQTPSTSFLVGPITANDAFPSQGQNSFTRVSRTAVASSDVPIGYPDFRAFQKLTSWRKQLNVAALAIQSFA